MAVGIFAVFTGNGKGKTTAALGHVARALGHGKKVCVIQFIKGGWQTGEEQFYTSCPGVDFHVRGRGFTWKSEDLDKDIEVARKAWSFAQEIIKANQYDLLVLDELTYLAHYSMISEEEILRSIGERPPSLHIIVTGRYAGEKMIEQADLVTEMKEVKHPYKQGVKAQAGFDF
ncbi:cob(I)yrinic acid a,c-diamide adenosyltransferase [Desulfotalea psychrophila]|nr:cob(I)yrinic acid a,c-diamide adenosyltransferase [Desulfotalea psychrophila]